MLTSYYNYEGQYIFVNFKETYDNINRTTLISVLKNLKTLPYLIRLVTMTLKNTSRAFKSNGRIGKEFKVRKSNQNKYRWTYSSNIFSAEIGK